MAGPAYFDAFRRIVVQPDNITIAADAVDDTLTLVAGAGISLVANAGSDQITIVNTNTSSPTNDLFAKSLTVDGIIIDTNVIRGTDSNADLELDANGTGAVSVVGNLKVSGALASSSTKLAIGSGAGTSNQTTGAIAIGTQAGETNQSLAISIGLGTGQLGQSFMATAVGNGAAQVSQGTYAVAIGTNSGQLNQGSYAVAIGSNAGTTNQPANSIIINAGSSALEAASTGLFIDPIRNVTNGNLLTYDTSTKEITYTNGNDLTIGSIRINTNVIQTVDSNADLELDANGTGAVSVIGDLKVSGNIATTSSKIAIGGGSGLTSQGILAVAVGLNTGNTSQGDYAIAIGNSAGQTNQGLASVAVGASSGLTDQGTYAVAVGALAANNYQSQYGVAIGYQAGNSFQGANAVAIGRQAGQTTQPANSIVINASGTQLDGSASGLFINPIRQVSGSNLLSYNSSTKEITYTNIIDSISISDNIIQTVDSNADLELDASGTGVIQLRSNLKLSDGTSPDGTWTNFTPTWTAGTSNPSIGNGILEGTYKRVGNTVHVWIMMTAGSTTTFGSGEYKISLPVTARAISRAVLSLVMNDDGTRLYNSLAHNSYTTTLSLDSDNVTLFWDTGVVTHNSPFTWANGDWFIVSGTYEAS